MRPLSKPATRIFVIILVALALAIAVATVRYLSDLAEQSEDRIQQQESTR